MPSNPQKNLFRQQLREKRRGLSNESTKASQKHFTGFLDQLVSKNSIDWLSYLSFENEFPTEEHFHWAKNRGDRVFFPRVSAHHHMEFRKLDSLDEAVSGKWMKEPPQDGKLWEPSKVRSIALVPGVGFSVDLHRLGFGKGYYDQFLVHYPQIFKMGLAYGFQILSSKSWPSAPHDVLMDGIYSPEGYWGHFPTF